jgi:hypothetical protein
LVDCLFCAKTFSSFFDEAVRILKFVRLVFLYVLQLDGENFDGPNIDYCPAYVIFESSKIISATKSEERRISLLSHQV